MEFLFLSLFCLTVALIACRHCRVTKYSLGSVPPMLCKQAE